MRKRWIGWLAAIGCAAAPALAQLQPALGGLAGGLTGGLPVLGSGPGALPPVALGDTLDGPLDRIGGLADRLSPASLLDLRRERLRTLVQDHRDLLELDDHGNPIRRGEIVGIALAPESLARARAAGFRLIGREDAGGLGVDAVVLGVPAGSSARDAIKRLRRADPAGNYSFDPVYEPAFARLAAGAGAVASQGAAPPGGAIGLIDGGVASHPAFAGIAIEQRGFAGPPRPSGHGTAVASLLVGRAGAFRGADPGAPLLVADVYGGSPANGSATAILNAMGWLAARGARVINISLVGPPSPLLEAGVRALQKRGVLIVAAVGNDGPAAPPQYPASYPGVIAVTAVDAHDHVLIEAGRATHLDFAAPGADMAAAVNDGGWQAVRGTSFAAPLVAGSLARADHGDAAAALAAVARAARPGRHVGRGIICDACRTPPRAMGVRE